jgi:thioesterase domain-containing protein
MLAVQPNGPYHLMGFSYGAHLAYEVACKLAAAQQSVGLLALVDAPPGFERLEPMAGNT